MTIKTLTELAQAIDAGKKFEYLTADNEWWSIESKDKRDILDLIEWWYEDKNSIRIKPKSKVIDMTPFISNKLDCEFSDGLGIWHIGKLRCVYSSTFHGDCGDFVYCRPRLSHPFIWENQKLPEGLIVEYGIFDGSSKRFVWYEIKCEDTCVARIIGKEDGFKWAGEE